MLSRVAENLYWISRYVERAENVARLLDDGFHLELDAAGLAFDDHAQSPVESVLTILTCQDAFAQAQGPRDGGAVLRFLTFDRKNPQAILAMIGRARENARGAQEVLSNEAWSQVNRLYLYLASAKAQRRFRASPFRFYDSLKRACVLFSGLVDSTLPRSEVFYFLQLGRYLERVDMISRTLGVKCRPLGAAGAADPLLPAVYWASLLRNCSAYETYLKEYHEHIAPVSVLHYLVLNADFPRSMRFGVARCLESLGEIAGGTSAAAAAPAERLLGRLDGQLRYLDLEEMLAQGLSGFFTSVQETCNQVGDAIRQAYFLH